MRCTSSIESRPLTRRMNSRFEGHHGASSRTTSMYRRMASSVAGSSHDSGRCTVRASIASAGVVGQPSSPWPPARDLARRPERRVELDQERADPGRHVDHRRRAVVGQPTSRAWTRARSARSRRISPYSTSTKASPERRMVNEGRPPSAGSAASTPRRGRAAGEQRLVARHAERSGDLAARRARSSARPGAIGTNLTASPGASWPSFQRSADTTVAGQVKPPRLGPSGPSTTGVSPVKSIVPNV